MRPTASDRYAFDVSGYLVVPGVLTPAELAVFNHHLDTLDPESVADVSERVRSMRWLFDLHPDFATLMDHPAVLPLLEEWVDERLRIDHAEGAVNLPGEGLELHGGPGDDELAVAWYRVQAGRISCGLTVVSWALTDCSDGGGFRCVPGSHKASFDRDDAGAEDRAIEVKVNAGDVIIFTEALVHGSVWRGPGSRRVLLYKYAPGAIGYFAHQWTDEEQGALSDRQRLMTLPPFEFDLSTGTKRRKVRAI